MSGTAGLWDGVLWLTYSLLYVRSVSRFLGRHLSGGRREERIFGLLFFCGCLLRKIWMTGGVPYILYAACGHVLLGIFAMVVFGGEKAKRLLAAVFAVVMTELIWNFGESFFSCGALLLIRVAKSNGQTTVSIGSWTGRILTIMTYGVGIWAVSRLSEALELVFTGKRESWYFCLSLPLMFMVFVIDLVNWAASNGIMVQDWRRFGLYENQLFSHGAMCIFTGLSMAASGFFVFGMDRIWREEQEREQYQAQVAYYKMLEEQYGRIERLRHDMKNHMLALENLARNQQWQQAVEYLREMTEMGGVGTGDEATGSLVMDALLYHKRQQAVEMNIRWQCDVKVPKDCPVKEIDLCIIAGNILDNALEACAKLHKREETFIQVYMGMVKKCLFLEARNSMAEKETGGGIKSAGDIGGRLKNGRSSKHEESVKSSKSPKNGESRKENFPRHGLGLRNIRSAAEKYNGAVRVEAENGIFTISVLLPLYWEEDRKR